MPPDSVGLQYAEIATATRLQKRARALRAGALQALKKLKSGSGAIAHERAIQPGAIQ